MILLEPVLEHYAVQHRSMPGWQNVRCPVHDDSTASCSLSLESGYLDCHACGFKGTAVDLVMEKEGMDREAATAFYQAIPGSSDPNLRGRSRRSGELGGRVPAGTGFRPRYGAGFSSRVRGQGGSWV